MATLRSSVGAFRLFFHKRLFRSFSSIPAKEEAPLMINEILEQLDIKDNQTVLDMTFGDGHHTEAILQSNRSVKVIALDRDPSSFQKANALALNYPGRVTPLLGLFSDLPSLLECLGVKRSSLDAVMLDMGCSSLQLGDEGRGFSYKIDGPLDMRMNGLDASDSITAQDILMKANEYDLGRILRIYGGEEQGKKIAQAIVTCRYTFQPLQSTLQLKDFLKEMCAEKSSKVVKNVFYALRVFVNNEFNELNYAMLLAELYLKKGGRITSLTFNQLEDTIVKRHITGNVLENNPNPVPLKYYSQSHNLTPNEINKLRSSQWFPLTKHVVSASGHNTSQDLRVKMARLRGAVKL